ncbi:MAG: serine hydrolase domain-containing protein [Bacteroidota bacterium]
MKRMLKIVSALGLMTSLYLPILVVAQDLPMGNPEALGFATERLGRLDDAFQEYVDDQAMAGSVILVARRGEVAYFNAFGYGDVAKGVKMEKDAIFRIASQTKALVSVAIMMLQEEGKLLINDPVSKYIPAFSETKVAVMEGNSYDVVAADRPISIRQLLMHTAGIGYGFGAAADQWKQAGIQGWYFADREEPILETVKRMASLPMDAQPGTRWVYGYNTDILGAVVEVASGMPLDKFLSERIFVPLGMNDTHFYLPKSKSSRLATVYSANEDGTLVEAPVEGTMDSQGAYVKGPRTSFSGGAGVLSTAKDYYLFLQMLANRGELNGQRLLAPGTVDLMTQSHLQEITFPWAEGCGFGLGFRIIEDLGAYGEPGSVGSYSWGGAYGSEFWVDPGDDLIVVYFTQLRPGSRVSDRAKLRALVYAAIVD